MRSRGAAPFDMAFLWDNEKKPARDRLCAYAITSDSTA